MNKKGFTLIELLAVIIILAVIALIATPVVLNVIEKARLEAAENSAYGVIDAAKYAYIDSLLTENPEYAGDVTSLKVSGTQPTAGSWFVNSEAADGTPVISLDGLVIGGYKCDMSGGNGAVVCTVSK